MLTIIAAIARDGHVVMGSDTACDYSGTIIYKASGKIGRFTSSVRGTVSQQPETFLIGGAGNSAIVPVLQRNLSLKGTPPPAVTTEDADEWAGTVAAAVTDILHNTKPALTTSPSDSAATLDGVLLLAWRTHLWMLFTHAAIRSQEGVAAVGSGTDVALGAMHTALALGDTPRNAVARAVTLASTYADGCRIDGRGPILHSTMED